jgi:hypothetical protein
MVMRRAGKASPEAISAEHTRSRASETALSGRPTMAKTGMPGATCTCTSTGRTSMPSKATVATRWTILALLSQALLSQALLSQAHSAQSLMPTNRADGAICIGPAQP